MSDRQIREENGNFHPTVDTYTAHTMKFNQIQTEAGGEGEGWYSSSKTLGLEENPQPSLVAGPRNPNRFWPPVWQLRNEICTLGAFLSAVGGFSGGRVDPANLRYSVWNAVRDKSGRRIGGAENLVLISNQGSGGGWALLALHDATGDEFENGLLEIAVNALLGQLGG